MFKNAKARACKDMGQPVTAKTKDLLSLAKEKYRLEFEIPDSQAEAMSLLSSVFGERSKLRDRI